MKKYLMILIIFLGIIFTSRPMNSQKSSFFKRAAGTCATIATGTITAGYYWCAYSPTWVPSTMYSISLAQENKLETDMNLLTDEAQAFIREQLAIQKVPNPESIKILRKEVTKYDLSRYLPAAKSSTIIVPSYIKKGRMTSKLEQILAKQAFEDTCNENKKLNEQRYLYRNEANHIAYKDMQTRILAGFSIPIVTQQILYLIKNKMKISLPKRSLKTLFILPIGVAQGFGNLWLFKQYNQFQEQRADDKIIDEIETIIGAISFFNKYQKKVVESFVPLFFLLDKKDQKKYRKKIFNHLDKSHFNDHPTTNSRIKRFKKRLQ